MSYAAQRRALQAAVSLAALVPILAGLWGVTFGLDAPRAAIDSQYRYLSGILIAIGAAYLWTVPRIERRAGPFRLLSALVVAGGLARLGAALAGGGGGIILFGLGMELVVVPLLFFWRERVQRMDPEAPSRYGGPWG